MITGMPGVESFRRGVVDLISSIALPDIKIRQIQNPSLERARELEADGDWEEALRHFYTMYLLYVRGNEYYYLIRVSQMLINLNRFSQAKRFLFQAIEDYEYDQPDKITLAEAYEKLAWIADYEGRYRDELNFLSYAERIVLSLSSEFKESDRAKAVMSTLNHFRGRARFGLAKQGVERNSNLAIAMSHFASDYNDLIELSRSGIHRPANLGFSAQWMTMVLLENGASYTMEMLERTKRHFVEASGNDPNTGFMANYHLLAGLVYVRQLKLDKGKNEFENALRIHTKRKRFGKPYPRGKSNAHIGLALSALSAGNPIGATAHACYAIRTYPPALLRSSFF
ncbi:MAG: hypothetical protein NZM26_01300 [Patescibacteria group bacterium]|nr:hypothetical protein [Patescibacteria group bacterium]